MTPDEYTNEELMLDVGDGHVLNVHDWGNPKAATVIIFLHGGPGSEIKDGYKQFFEPTEHRVIFFDQRGCGKSTPYGSLENNTTDKSIADIMTLADHFNLQQFVLFGGSWGSCLSLATGLKYPERIKAMVLHGIFTSSASEVEWLDRGRFQNFFPDVWQRYLDATPPEHRKDPSAYHYQQVMGKDEEAAKRSALAYETLEGSTMKLDDRYQPPALDDYDPAGMRIEMHFMHNLCFMPDRYILDNAHKLGMPIYLVQGRYDMVCPPTTAYELHSRLQQSRLYWTLSGHRGEHETWTACRMALAQALEA